MKNLSYLALAAALAVLPALAREAPIALKPGAGKEKVEALCSGCHSLDYIRLNSAFMNRQTWTAEVTKMINAFGAPIPKEDEAVILDYLTAIYGVR